MGVPDQDPRSVQISEDDGCPRSVPISEVDGCPRSVAHGGTVFGTGVGGTKEHAVLPVVEDTHR